MHGCANGLPLADDLRDVVSDLLPPGEGVVRATNPHTKDPQQGAIRDDISTAEAIKEGSEGWVVRGPGTVGFRSNQEDIRFLKVELRANG